MIIPVVNFLSLSASAIVCGRYNYFLPHLRRHQASHSQSPLLPPLFLKHHEIPLEHVNSPDWARDILDSSRPARKPSFFFPHSTPHVRSRTAPPAIVCIMGIIYCIFTDFTATFLFSISPYSDSFRLQLLTKCPLQYHDARLSVHWRRPRVSVIPLFILST